MFTRYSDFLVNEVSSAGEIVCITEQMIPHEPEEIPCKYKRERERDVGQFIFHL